MTTRVVLLARPGVARERTEAALAQAGMPAVASIDPVTATEAEIRAHRPHALLVVLDPVVDQTVDRLAGLLGDPTVEVMFDDAEVAARREGWDASRWSRHLAAKLQGHDDVLPSAPPAAGGDAPDPLQAELAALQKLVEQMPEVPMADTVTAPTGSGAILIAGGVGGPDAARQLLSALPAALPVPLLLRQRIDGGHFDRLVRQMQRATDMPVELAQMGSPAAAGHLYVLPDGLDVAQEDDRLYFVASSGQPTFAGLRPAASALVLLSGADLSLVDLGLVMHWAGGLVLGQASRDCFDPSASESLVARGGLADTLPKIAARLINHWPS